MKTLILETMTFWTIVNFEEEAQPVLTDVLVMFGTFLCATSCSQSDCRSSITRYTLLPQLQMLLSIIVFLHHIRLPESNISCTFDIMESNLVTFSRVVMCTLCVTVKRIQAGGGVVCLWHYSNTRTSYFNGKTYTECLYNIMILLNIYTLADLHSKWELVYSVKR